jgi:hypothetical protein
LIDTDVINRNCVMITRNGTHLFGKCTVIHIIAKLNSVESFYIFYFVALFSFIFAFEKENKREGFFWRVMYVQALYLYRLPSFVYVSHQERDTMERERERERQTAVACSWSTHNRSMSWLCMFGCF